MKTVLFKGLSDREILDNLEAENCGVESSHEFLKPFTDEEQEEMENQFIQSSKKLEAKEQEKVKVVTPLNQDIKALKKETTQARRLLAQGGELVTEQVYLFPDYEHKVMGLYDQRGVLVGTRPMSRSERQLHINSTKHLEINKDIEKTA